MSIGSIPFVLVGTEIDKRTKILGGENADVLPMSLSQAETFAKRIGASKYLECSAATGVSPVMGMWKRGEFRKDWTKSSRTHARLGRSSQLSN